MANDGFTILNPGAGGAAMDESELAYGSPPLIRKRERVVLGGDSDPAALCDPIAVPPAGAEYGLPVRQVGKLQVEGVPGGVPIPVDLVIGDTVTTNQGTPNIDANSWPVHQVGAAPLPAGAATDAGLAAIFGRQADGSQHTIVDNFPATQAVTGPLTDAQLRAAAVPVSLAVAPLPAGAATEATLALIKAKTDNLDVALSTRAVTGLTDSQLRASAVPVSGPLTDAQLRASAVPVSAASLPLPAGAATEATLALIKAKTDNLDVLLSSRAVTGLTDAELRASAVPVDVSDRAARLLGVLSTGGNTIGKVDQGTGGASAWKVDGSAVTQPVSGPLTDAQLRASNVPVDVSDRAARLLGVLSAGANIIGKVGLDAASLAGIALDATVAAVRDRLPAALIGGRLDVNVGASVLPPLAAQDHITAAVPGSARLSDGAAFYDAAKTGQLPAALVGGRLDENLGAWLGSTTPTVGQKAMAASLPVAIASDQTAVPVSAASLPLPTGASTAANQTTLGSQTTKVNDGTNTMAVKAASTAPVATDPAAVVAVSPNTPLPTALASSGGLKVSDIGTRVTAGKYGCGTPRVAGTAGAQNIATIANPAASGKVVYVRRVVVSCVAGASAQSPYEYSLARTTAAVTAGGAVATSQKRATADATAVAEVRSGAVTATAAAGSLWTGTGAMSAATVANQPSQVFAWDSRRDDDDIALAAGEALLVSAEGNDTDLNHVVSFFWQEV